MIPFFNQLWQGGMARLCNKDSYFIIFGLAKKRGPFFFYCDLFCVSGTLFIDDVCEIGGRKSDFSKISKSVPTWRQTDLTQDQVRKVSNANHSTFFVHRWQEHVTRISNLICKSMMKFLAYSLKLQLYHKTEIKLKEFWCYFFDNIKHKNRLLGESIFIMLILQIWILFFTCNYKYW